MIKISIKQKNWVFFIEIGESFNLLRINSSIKIEETDVPILAPSFMKISKDCRCSKVHLSSSITKALVLEDRI